MTGILNTLIAGVSGAVKDAYFNLVSLLLPGNGTNGAQNNTFLDSSTNNFTITRNGNTTQGTFSPFSQTGWGNYFNGSNAYFSFAAQTDFAFGTGDFTIETFVFLNSTGDQTIIDFRPSSTNGAYPLIHIAGGKFNYYANSAGRIDSDSSVVANRWYHLVVSRVGATTRMFVDGVAQTQTYSDSTNYIVGASRPVIGIGGYNLTALLNGYLSNFRVLKGTGFTSVTVPTAPFPTGTANQVLLTCQANRFIDSNTATTAKTINLVGSPSVVAFSPFAPTAAYTTAAVGGSGYFDGTGDYVTTASSTAFAFGTGNWTCEAWVYLNAYTTGAQTCFFNPSTNNENLDIGGTTNNPGRFTYYNGSGAVVGATGNVPLLQWVHLAAVRNGTTVTLFVNGSSVGSGTLSAPNNTAALSYFIAGTSGGSWANGYMSNARIVKGTAVYTGNFTPPTLPLSTSGSASASAYPSTTNVNTSFSSSECSLLLNYTNAGITDATAKNDLETVGNAQISTSVRKFGGGSIAFDGTGDWLVTDNSDNILGFGTGDWTIEFWLRLNSTGTQVIFDGRRSSASDVAPLVYYSSGLKYYTASGDRISGGTLSTGVWYYIAIVKSSGSTRMYIDGSQTGSTYTDGNNYIQQSQRPIIGAEGVSVGSNPLNGYIDDFRITKGYARTVTTVPSAPFPVQ